MVPATVFAQEGGLCEHHTQHDASCGYTEGTAEVPCAHAHTEQCYTSVTQCVHTHTEQCYLDGTLPAEGEEKTADACAHQCSEESGCITKTLSCQHQHDAVCGYAPATAGTPCTYVCEICNSEEAECICETPCTPESVDADCPVCSAEGADLAACKGTAPAVCTCQTLCTPENIHADCPVCSAAGADLAACKGTVPVVCTCETLCTQESVDADCPVCSAEGADLAACKGAAVCTCETLCTEEEINTDCPVCSAEGAELDNVCVGAAPMLPVTALAAGEDAPGTLYVGNQLLSIAENTFWTTDSSTGSLTEYKENGGEWNVKYDSSSNTLTLKGATIKGGSNTTSVPFGAGIYAVSRANCDVALTIKLEGTSTVSGIYGVCVQAKQTSDSGGNSASLTILGDGTLTAIGNSNYGIAAFGYKGGAALTIENATVNASTSGGHVAGVGVQSGSQASNSPQLSLTVKGGSLTASGGTSSDGILFYVGSPNATATTSLTVSDNAIVDARNGGISALKILETLPTPTPTGDNRSGIVFDGSTGTVYGNVELQENLEIGEGETLTIGDGASLNTGSHAVIVNGGTLNGADKIKGTVKYAPAITTQPTSQTVKEDEPAAFTVTASGSDLTYQWQQSTDSGITWTNIGGATSKTYTISNAAPDWDGRQYRCVVTNSVGSVTSSAATLTVQENPDYKISSSPATMDFDTVTEGYSERNAQMVCIENLGNRPMTLTQPVSATGNFVVSALSDTVLPVSGAAVFTVRPRTGLPAGTYTEDILFSANPIGPDSGSGVNVWVSVSVTFTVKHDLVRTEYKAPSCTKDGNLEFWTCRVCGKHFLDDQGKYPIKEADTVLQATGHSYRFGRCTVCGAKDPKYKPGTICPQTGDTTPITLYVSVLLTSGAALLALGTRKRRKC